MNDSSTREPSSMPLMRVIAGALGGFVATAPMSVVMLAWHRRLPWHQRDPLPPKQITQTLLWSADLHDDLGSTEQNALSAANHFAYGALMGAGYGCLNEVCGARGSVGSGVAYGVAVWAGNYLGLLPATGLYRSATQEPAGRNAMMFAAHVVWGASLGLVTAALTKRNRARPARSKRENQPAAERSEIKTISGGPSELFGVP